MLIPDEHRLRNADYSFNDNAIDDAHDILVFSLHKCPRGQVKIRKTYSKQVERHFNLKEYSERWSLKYTIVPKDY